MYFPKLGVRLGQIGAFVRPIQAPGPYVWNLCPKQNNRGGVELT